MALSKNAKQKDLEDITKVPETEPKTDSEEEGDNSEDEDHPINQFSNSLKIKDDESERAAWKYYLRLCEATETAKSVHLAIQYRLAFRDGDVSDPAHHRHGEMSWRFCGFNGCQAHLSGKTDN